MTHPNSTAILTRRLHAEGLSTTRRDVAGFYWESTITILLLYAILAAALVGIVSCAVFAVVPVLYSRFVLAEHELLHTRRPPVNYLMRLQLFGQSLLTLGYDEQRDIHLRHHSQFGTDADPEHYLIAVGHLRAFSRAFFATELVFIRFVRRKGMSRKLLVDLAVRASAFVLFALVNPEVFLIYLLILRFTLATAEFMFHHVLHMPDVSTRNRWLQSSPWLWRFVGLLLGREKVAILLEHDVHHRFPLVGAKHLSQARLLAEVLPETVEEAAWIRSVARRRRYTT